MRKYGDSGAVVIVLHGGPAAVGSAKGLAEGIADSFRVLEPWQRGSGNEPLTVARHVADLHELVLSINEKPALVGHSWGAMLALAYAAEHPDSMSRIVLVGSGTFDPVSRARFKELHASQEHSYYEIFPEEPDPEVPPFDMQAHTETWEDMLRLQKEGVYPAAFSKIMVPIIMLHGTDDPHPGRMICENLKKYIPHLEYKEWERCGHEPWKEKHARADFIRTLRDWLNE